VQVGYIFNLAAGGTGSVDGNGNTGTFDHLTGLDGCTVGSATTQNIPGTSGGGDAGTLTVSAAGQSADITITAPIVHTLTLNVTATVAGVYSLSIGGGSGGFSPPGQQSSCSVTVTATTPANNALCGTFTFDEGTVVTVDATPANTSWTGDCTGSPGSANVTMDGDKTCTGVWP
jgi:hypothetical protein